MAQPFHKPMRKIIQLTWPFALCSDGSVWEFSMVSKTWGMLDTTQVSHAINPQPRPKEDAPIPYGLRELPTNR